MSDDTVMVPFPRALFTVTEAPRCTSQKTCLTVTGIPPRDYLVAVRAYAAAGGTVAHLGKLRVVELDPFVAWLGRRATTTKTPSTEPADPVDALAGELGLAPVLPMRRAGGVR